VAETVALTLAQIAAQKEAADRDRQRQLEWAVVIPAADPGEAALARSM
jgi:hypothetical protein